MAKMKWLLLGERVIQRPCREWLTTYRTAELSDASFMPWDVQFDAFRAAIAFRNKNGDDTNDKKSWEDNDYHVKLPGKTDTISFATRTGFLWAKLGFGRVLGENLWNETADLIAVFCTADQAKRHRREGWDHAVLREFKLQQAHKLD